MGFHNVLDLEQPQSCASYVIMDSSTCSMDITLKAVHLADSCSMDTTMTMTKAMMIRRNNKIPDESGAAVAACEAAVGQKVLTRSAELISASLAPRQLASYQTRPPAGEFLRNHSLRVHFVGSRPRLKGHVRKRGGDAHKGDFWPHMYHTRTNVCLNRPAPLVNRSWFRYCHVCGKPLNV